DDGRTGEVLHIHGDCAFIHYISDSNGDVDFCFAEDLEGLTLVDEEAS
ncbi:MAG: hypothetical protein GY773_17115, partial [Actinomycetia bacterium]|nr:hypothetical protein [Actinomycetes bacterium]